MKYEYRRLWFDMTDSTYISSLNEVGQGGWELVMILAQNPFAVMHPHIFKRLLS